MEEAIKRQEENNCMLRSNSNQQSSQNVQIGTTSTKAVLEDSGLFIKGGCHATLLDLECETKSLCKKEKVSKISNSLQFCSWDFPGSWRG